MTAIIGFIAGLACGALLAWLALVLVQNRERKSGFRVANGDVEHIESRRWLTPL